jgi:subtilisin family serine protease
LTPFAPGVHNDFMHSRWIGSRGAVLVGVAVLILMLSAPMRAEPGSESAVAEAQRLQRMEAAIGAWRAEKLGRNAGERKLASRLLRAERAHLGVAPRASLQRMRSNVELDARGRCEVDLRASPTPALLSRIEAAGGEIVATYPAMRRLRAHIPVRALSQVAAHPDVDHIAPAAEPAVRMVDTSEGDVAHRAATIRANGSVDGTGVKVGVISDGVDSLAAVQASGDLPAVTVLPGLLGAGTEGTALLEIVHDLAPGAELLFATGRGGVPAFAASVNALAAAGADVIVDDLFYVTEAVLQDDGLAGTMTTAANAGVVVISAVGNAGNLISGTAGVWEGDWNDSGVLFDGFPMHDFGGGATDNTILADTNLSFTLQWSDPLGGSGNDYDLLLFDPLGNLIDCSDDIQNGSGFPFEEILSTSANDTGNRLVILLFSGSARYLHLNANRGELAIATDGQIFGHSAAPGVIGVAAAHVSQASAPDGGFDGSEWVQSFSSEGPRRVFHDLFGAEITPGNLLATGGELRQAPTLTAADCVSTQTPGFSTFCGTSAAAPHVAAIAALLLEIDPSADVAAALTGSALDLETPGVDSLSGHGMADAFAAAEAVLMPEPGVAPSLAAAGAWLLALARRRRLR